MNAVRKRDGERVEDRPFYHCFAWAYDLIIDPPGERQLAAIAEAFAHAGVNPGASLVDAGCGTGAYALGLAALGFGVTAVDSSHELLAEAEARAQAAAADVELACGDFTRGWRPAQLADGVLCRGVLNDLLDDAGRQRALASFASWLRPGGALLLDVRDAAASGKRYATPRTFERTVSRGDDTLTFTSISEMEASSHILRVVERWSGTVGGVPVEAANQFAMRCWTWDELDHL